MSYTWTTIALIAFAAALVAGAYFYLRSGPSPPEDGWGGPSRGGPADRPHEDREYSDTDATRHG